VIAEVPVDRPWIAILEALDHHEQHAFPSWPQSWTNDPRERERASGLEALTE
jgi:hypothetical protein